MAVCYFTISDALLHATFAVPGFLGR